MENHQFAMENQEFSMENHQFDRSMMLHYITSKSARVAAGARPSVPNGQAESAPGSLVRHAGGSLKTNEGGFGRGTDIGSMFMHVEYILYTYVQLFSYNY